MGKRMLLISTSGGPNFGQYAPLLVDWASTYRDSLKVVVAFRSLVPTDWKKQLASTGIVVIPNTIRLQTVIDPCSMDYSFLIDEHGKITYRFQFEVGRWSELSGTIDQFARKALSPKPVQVSSLKMGARLSLKNGLDAKGNRFQPDQFLGKPTIFFLLKPCTLTNQAVNLLMLNLKERFGNLANIVAIYYLYDFQTEQGVKEYYTRYGMGEVCASEELQNPWKSVDYTKNQGFTVFVDQNGQIMDRSRFRTLPTVLIADRQLNLVDVIGLASNDTPGVEEVEKVIAGVVTGVQ